MKYDKNCVRCAFKGIKIFPNIRGRNWKRQNLHFSFIGITRFISDIWHFQVLKNNITSFDFIVLIWGYNIEFKIMRTDIIKLFFLVKNHHHIILTLTCAKKKHWGWEILKGFCKIVFIHFILMCKLFVILLYNLFF